MKGFLKDLYRSTRCDLNKLVPEVKTFKRLSQPEINKVVDNRGALVILFKYKGQEGVIFMTYTSTDLYCYGREENGVEIDGSSYRILGRPRNVVTLINRPETEYRAWALSFPDGDVLDKVEQRRKSKEGAILRSPEKYRYWSNEYDKNGYVVDRYKYKRMLEKMREENGLWANKIDSLMKEYLHIQEQIVKAKKFGSLRYVLKDAMEKISKASIYAIAGYSDDNGKRKCFEEAEKSVENLKKRVQSEGISL